jgi:hypothetical protein
VEKKIVYIGIAFIIASTVVILISGSTTSSITTGLQKYLITDNITIKSGGISSTSLSIPANSFIFAFVDLNRSANIYLFNNSAYGVWKNETNTANSPTGLENAKSLEGAGAFAIYRNATNATIPSGLGSSGSTPLYSVNQSQLFANGTYYFIIDNSNGSASSGSVVKGVIEYLPPFINSSFSSGVFAGLGSQLSEAVTLGIIFFVLFIVGIILVIYGLIKQPKNTSLPPPKTEQTGKLETKADQQYVDQLYKNIDGKKRKKKKQNS